MFLMLCCVPLQKTNVMMGTKPSSESEVNEMSTSTFQQVTVGLLLLIEMKCESAESKALSNALFMLFNNHQVIFHFLMVPCCVLF